MNIGTVPHRLFSKINRVLPKKNIILFYSTVDFNDNPFYLYKKAIELGVCEEYDCIWIVNSMEGKRRVETFGGHAIYRGDKRKLLRVISSAKYFVSANGPPLWKSSNQIAIELWHGLPIKQDGVWIGKSKYRIQPDFLIVPSRFVKVVYSSLFGVPPERILELGIPRTDVLFLHKDNTKLKIELKEKFDLPLEKRVILYAPTWRAWDPHAQFKLFLEIISNNDLQRLLDVNNAILVFKPHPHDEAKVKSFNFPRNVHIVTSSEMLKKGLTTNDLLLITDLLITDYSSIFWDYLILDRPIVFYAPDLEEYRMHRGLILEPFEAWVPGKVVYSPSVLVDTISDILEDKRDELKEKRKWLKNIAYSHQDGKSSERIIRYFWLNSKGDV